MDFVVKSIQLQSVLFNDKNKLPILLHYFIGIVLLIGCLVSIFSLLNTNRLSNSMQSVSQMLIYGWMVILLVGLGYILPLSSSYFTINFFKRYEGKVVIRIILILFLIGFVIRHIYGILSYGPGNYGAILSPSLAIIFLLIFLLIPSKNWIIKVILFIHIPYFLLLSLQGKSL